VKKLILIWLVYVISFIIASIVVGLSGIVELRAITDLLILAFVFLTPWLSRYWSIVYHVNIKWLLVSFSCIIALNVIEHFPGNFGRKASMQVKVHLPLILLVLDILYCKLIERAFLEHKNNINGQAAMSGGYIWFMESLRFECFLALYLGWKNKTVTDNEFLMNAINSLIGEILTHSGVRESLEDWLNRKANFRDWKPRVPHVRECFSSIRSILELVIPAVFLSILSFVELWRDYIVVIEDDAKSELRFFASAIIFGHILEISGVYYFLEAVAKVLCLLLKKVTGYHQISIVGSLGWYNIFLWVTALVLLSNVIEAHYRWAVLEIGN